MVMRPPEPNLPPHSMSWGRSVDDRIGETELRILAQASDDTGDAATTRAAADSISEQLGELVSVMGISRYTLPPFSVSYPGLPIGADPVLIAPPSWFLNVADGPELISVIVRLWVDDSHSPGIGPREGRILLTAGVQSGLFQDRAYSESPPLPRSMMLTVPARHPLEISVAFQHSGTSGGTLTGYGEATLVAYGR